MVEKSVMCVWCRGELPSSMDGVLRVQQAFDLGGQIEVVTNCYHEECAMAAGVIPDTGIIADFYRTRQAMRNLDNYLKDTGIFMEDDKFDS